MGRADRVQLRRSKSAVRERFEFLGGHLALDFANTLGGRRGGSTRELLVAYADLVTWGLQAGTLVSDEAQWFLDAAQRHAAHTAMVMERAHRLREAIYALFTACMRGDAVRNVDLAVLNSELTAALAHRQITTSADGVVWSWDWREALPEDGEAYAARPLDAVLWPVAVAAADLLIMRSERQPLRQCASDECSWLYLDATRNHSRRWCDMQGCGNKAKVRRYRQRQA